MLVQVPAAVGVQMVPASIVVLVAATAVFSWQL